MLSSAKISTASWQYYVRQEPCRAADYYLGHDQDAGVWLGRGLDRLGLEPGAEVSERELEALFGRAINPSTGQQLGRAWRVDGVTGFDLTFSAPKSVSALLAAADALAGPAVRRDGQEIVGRGLELDPPTESSRATGRSLAAEDVEVEEALNAARNGVLVGAIQRTEASRKLVETTPGEQHCAVQQEPFGGVPHGGASADGATAGGTGLRQAVTSAHDIATRTALAYLDRHASLSRRGTDGLEQVSSGGFTVAAFRHYTSREGDPQLHTHALVLNKVQCADGTWRALDGHEMYAHKKSAGMIYQAVLRNELAASLGVHFAEVSKDGQAEILGIPEQLLEKWSKRTHNVNAEAATAVAELEAKLQRSLSRDERAAVTKTAVLKTRPDKNHEHPQALAARWRAEAAALGIDLTQLLTVAQHAARVSVRTSQPGAQVPEREQLLTVDGLAQAALTAAGRSRAVFGRAEVAGPAAALLPTTGLAAADVLARVEAVADRALELAEAVGVGAPVHGVTPRESDARYATREVLDAETRILTLAQTGRRSGAGQVGYDQLRRTLATVRAGGVELDRSQVEALLHLASHGDRLNVLTAPAGAGKTATLGACAHAWHAAGYRVVGLAPSARAAAELAAALHPAAKRPDGQTAGSAAGGGRVDTLAKWLHTRALHPGLDQASHDQPDGVARGVGRAGWARLDPRTVLVVDEASMASTLDLDQLTQAVAAAGAKVVLVGDPAQIGVIDGPGGMLATLAHDGTTNARALDGAPGTSAGYAVALTAIHRFSQEWEKQASLALRAGARTALQPYLQQQRLHPCPDGESAADAVFRHWQHARRQGMDALMLARTRVDVDALNLRARAAAHTTDHATDPTNAEGGGIALPVAKLGAREWQAGDLLRTRKNNRQLTLAPGAAAVGRADEWVRNGDRYRVVGLTHATPADNTPGTASAAVTGLVVEDLTGRGRVVLPAAYVAKHCEYGWAATIDGSQGATSDLGLLLARPGLDREHLYVGMTRGRHGNHAYLAPDPADGPDHHAPLRPGRPRETRELDAACLEVLQNALAVSGAQDSATHALRRHHQTQRRDLPNPANAAAGTASATTAGRAELAQQRPGHVPPRPHQPTGTELRLATVQAERERLHIERVTVRTERDALYSRRRPLHQELTGLPRRAFARRRALTDRIGGIDTARASLDTQLARMDHTADTLAAQEQQLIRQVRTEQATRPTTRPTARPDAGSVAPRRVPGVAMPAEPGTTLGAERGWVRPRRGSVPGAGLDPRTSGHHDRLHGLEPHAGRDTGRGLDR